MKKNKVGCSQLSGEPAVQPDNIDYTAVLLQGINTCIDKENLSISEIETTKLAAYINAALNNWRSV